MKKKSIFLIIFFIYVFLNPQIVDAALNNNTVVSDGGGGSSGTRLAIATPSNTDLECVYANGVVAGLTYDATNKVYSAYIKDYPVSKTVNIEGDAPTTFSFFDNDSAVSKLKNFTCPSEIRYWIQFDDTSGNRVFSGIYAFDWHINGISITSMLSDTSKYTSGHLWWKEEHTTVNMGTIPVLFKEKDKIGIQSNCDDRATCVKDCGCSPEGVIPLVGERYFITGDLQGVGSHTFKSVSASEEAVSSTKYAQFYKTDKANIYLLQIGKTITSVDASYISTINSLSSSDNNANIYMCVKESVTTQDASRGNSEYKFSSIRHEISSIDKSDKASTCPSGYQKFELTTETCRINSGNSNNQQSFCDKYPATAKILIRIMQILQIFVPAVTIIFTGIELGRIVVAGTLEEELPKRKKSLIIRAIMMIVFFFLPTITRLIISLAEGVSILDVSCLFGEEKTNAEINEENCIPMDDN